MMNPDSLPSFDEWLKEAERLCELYAVVRARQNVGEMNGMPHWPKEVQAKLLAHLAAHPSAAPQGAQPAEPVPKVRMLTDDETAPMLDDIVGNYPSDLAEQIQRRFAEVNGLTIPAKEQTNG